MGGAAAWDSSLHRVAPLRKLKMPPTVRQRRKAQTKFRSTRGGGARIGGRMGGAAAWDSSLHRVTTLRKLKMPPTVRQRRTAPTKFRSTRVGGGAMGGAAAWDLPSHLAVCIARTIRVFSEDVKVRTIRFGASRRKGWDRECS